MAFELREIENAFMQEREEMLKTNAEEMEAFFDKHKQDEEKKTDQREARETENADLLDKLRSEKVNQYTDKKIALESDLQKLQK